MTAVESLKREVMGNGGAPEAGGADAPLLVDPNPEAAAVADKGIGEPAATAEPPEVRDDGSEAPDSGSEAPDAAIDDTLRLAEGPRGAVVIPLPTVATRAPPCEAEPKSEITRPLPAEEAETDAGDGVATENGSIAAGSGSEEDAEAGIEPLGIEEAEGVGKTAAEPTVSADAAADPEPATDAPEADPVAVDLGETGAQEEAEAAASEGTEARTEAGTTRAAQVPEATPPTDAPRVTPAAEDPEPEPDPDPDPDATPAETARARLATLFVVPAPRAGAPEEAPTAALPSVPAPTLARLRGAANPLMVAAGPVLEQVRLLRDAEAPEDADALGFELTRLLARYEEDAGRADLGPGAIQVGRFALAATLDDVLRTRPWADRCGWLHQGLAASGPERFFDLMRVMLNKPARHRAPLELFYACLSLGFEGRFRDKPRGVHDLNRIRDQLHRVLRRLGEPADRALSPTIAAADPADPARHAPYRPPPPLLSPRVAAPWLAALCLVFHFVGAWWLSQGAEPLARRLAATLPEREVATARPTSLPPMAGPELPTRIREALGDDIRAGAVEMLAGTDGALVLRLSGGAVFPAGSDAVRAFYRAVIDRVGKALAGEEGRIVVVAHSDSWALPTERFPTARSLTEARAEAVRILLERHLGGIRLSAEGRGDGEPIDTNDTPAGRAANRRVDIRLYP